PGSTSLSRTWRYSRNSSEDGPDPPTDATDDPSRTGDRGFHRSRIRRRGSCSLGDRREPARVHVGQLQAGVREQAQELRDDVADRGSLDMAAILTEEVALAL